MVSNIYSTFISINKPNNSRRIAISLKIKEVLRMFLRRIQRSFQSFKIWYTSDIGKPQPVYNHNRRQIVFSDKMERLEILFRVNIVQGQKLIKIGNSIGTTIDPDITKKFKETSETAQTFCGIIEYARHYDKDGSPIKEKELISGEPAILTTRLLNKELEK